MAEEGKDIVEDESPQKLGFMGTFNKVIQTISTPDGANKDNANAAFKVIQARALHSVSAIPTVRGGHGQHRIRGNSYQVITGNRGMIIGGDDLLSVAGEQTEVIKGKAEFLYQDDRNQATMGDEEWVVNKTRQCWVIGQSTDNFIDKHDTNAPESFEWKHKESSFIATINENCYFGNSRYAMKTEIGIVDNDLSLTGISFDKLHVKAEELVSGVKEALEDEAVTEALENPETASQALTWTTEALTATAGVAAGAKNWIGDEAGKAKDWVEGAASKTWATVKAHPVGAAVVGPEAEALEVPIAGAALGEGATATTAATSATAATAAAPAIGPWGPALAPAY